MKSLKSILLTSILLVNFKAISQQWGANTFSQFTNEANDVELNNNGEAYITGYISGETAFNSSNVVPSAAGNGDIYVAKYDAQGTLIWKKTFGGNFSDRAYDLAVGPDQNIIVTGQFFGSVTFGSTTLTSVGNSKDIFLIKLDPQGNVLWARSEGGSMAENAYGVTVDNQNNVILTGQFQGTTAIGSSTFTSEIDEQTNLPSYDLFISKYNSTGTPLWVRNGFAHYEDRGLAVAVDSQDNIFFTGQFSDTLEFAGNTYLNIGYNVGFLCKLNPAGQVQFFNFIRAGIVVPYDLELNTDNEVIVTGDFLGNMNYYDASGPHAIQNPYDKQIFIIKTNNSGAYSWNYTLGSDNELSARSVSIDPHKDVFVTGYFKCALSQAHDTSTIYFNSVGFKDPYLLKVDNQGNLEYLKQIGGKMDDVGNGVAVGANDAPLICGAFTKDLNIPYNYNSTYPEITSFGLTAQTFSEPSHVFLQGDSTYNSFLLKCVNNTTPLLDYFYYQLTDSTEGFLSDYNGYELIQDADTLDFCIDGLLYYNELTYEHLGPSYSYQWMNTDTTADDSYFVNTSGDYFVKVMRDDQCDAEMDSVYVNIVQNPYLPLLSDNLGINNLTPGGQYHGFVFCDSGSVTLTFSNPDPTADFSFMFNDSLYYGLGPHSFNEEGTFSTLASNGVCAVTDPFGMDFIINSDYDTIQPDIVMYPNVPTGNSATICSGTSVNFHAIDLFTNPSANFNPVIGEPPVQVIWSVNGTNYAFYDSTDYYYGYDFTFNPSTSGWYTIGVKITLGYDNQCGLDTTQYYYEEDFYITVNPNPTWSCSISGDAFLCPEGSEVLNVSNTDPALSWDGPGIIDTPSANSVVINAIGVYTYGGTLTNPLTGCSSYVQCAIEIVPKEAPSISSVPNDALICPYDSVLMSIPNTYLSYNWVGPAGDNLSNTHEVYGDEMGFYYCHVVDDEGCNLTTPPYELREYSTPGITVYPDVYLCEGESVDIEVTYTGDATFQWINFTSTQDHITVTQAGVYAVQISQCGFTVTDSIEIIDGTFEVSISTTDSLLCFGEATALIGSQPGMNYEWNNGQITANSYVVDEAGIYSAIVTNNYGCTASTNTITIQSVPESTPPTIPDQTVCPGANVTLSDNSPYTLNWYNSSDSSFLFTGETLSLSNLLNDTSFVIAYSSNACSPAFGIVTIEIQDSLSNFTILGDSLLCINENGQFYVTVNDENIEWFVGAQSFGTSNPVSIDYNILSASSTITLQISNECFSSTIQETVTILPQTTISIVEDSISLCYYDSEVLELSNSNLDSIIWTSALGTETSEGLVIYGSNTYGIITVVAYDQNGCITSIDTATIITPNFNSSINVDFSNFCTGDSGTISLQSNADSLIWSTPNGMIDTTSISFSVSDTTAGLYILQQWDNLGCHYTDTVVIPEYQAPNIDILPDSIYCVNDIYTFYFPNDTNTYSWTTFGNSPDIPILDDQDLILTVTTPNGCLTFDTLFVQTVNCEDDVPNFITANGDGTNDYLFIDDALSQLNNEIIIYNRYGNLIFSAAPYTNNFDGENLNAGVYFYVYYPNGRSDSQNYRQGFLHILR